MRRLLESVIYPLLAPRSQRALDETLLDWSHEALLAPTLPARAVCCVRAFVALARTLATITIRDAVTVWRSPALVRTAFWLGVGFVAASIIGGSQWRRFPYHSWDDLLFVSLSGSAFVMMPLALYLAVTTKTGDSPPPVLGLALSSVILMWLGADWILPVTFQHFRESMDPVWDPSILPRGPAEQSFRELRSGFVSYADLKQLSHRLAIIVACPVLRFLAGHVRCLTNWYRRAVTVAVLASYLRLSSLAARLGPATGYWDLVGLWLALIAALASGVLFALSRGRRELKVEQ